MMSRKVKQQVNSAVNELDMNLANNYKDLAHKALKELDELVTKLNEEGQLKEKDYTKLRDKVFHTQLGVKLCSMAGGGVQKIYMVFLREPSRRDRSGSDLFHLRDGFEIKMNFDRNVPCFIFVNALMHDDFFD